MQKVFHFDAPREKYQCGAAVVWCFDSRFHLGFSKFLKRLGVVNADPITIAGGAKVLASPARESDREFVLEQLRTSMRLHGTKLVILMVHSDCGAYGGLDAFGGDLRVEAEYLESELQSAADYLRRQLPGVEVQAYFADFEGIWAVDVVMAARPA